MSQVDPTYNVFSGLAAVIAAQSASFSPVPAKIGWDPTCQNHPLFQHWLPAGASAVFVVPEHSQRTDRPSVQHRWALLANIVCYLGQTVGANHSQAILAFATPILNILTTLMQSTDAQVTSVGMIKVLPELRFKWWDDPGRRQSVATIEIKMEANHS